MVMAVKMNIMDDEIFFLVFSDLIHGDKMCSLGWGALLQGRVSLYSSDLLTSNGNYETYISCYLLQPRGCVGEHESSLAHIHFHMC